jgi:bifunctional non-homologous end joining protein LigD
MPVPVRTGADVEELLRRLPPLETAKHAFELGDAPRKTRDIHWCRPALAAEVEIAEFTASGKIRQGSYKGLRLDKTADDLREHEALG